MIVIVTPQTIADGFVADLRGALSVEEWRGMVAANRAETLADVCHSHDYLDANDVMFDVMERAGVPMYDADGQMRDDTIRLWNDAWRLAADALRRD